MVNKDQTNIIEFTSATLSTEIISFSVSVNVVKKPFSSDTTGAAYDRARPTCSRFLYDWCLVTWNRTFFSFSIRGWKCRSRRSVNVSCQTYQSWCSKVNKGTAMEGDSSHCCDEQNDKTCQQLDSLLVKMCYRPYWWINILNSKYITMLL